MQETKSQKRLVSYKVWINNILKGHYIKEEGWQPNYIQIGGLKVSRINIVGIVVLKEDQNKFSSIMLDDGSGKIQVRSFENALVFQNVSVGDAVLIVGRIREFNNEIYVMPEIVRRIDDKRWLKVRQLELKDFKPVATDQVVEKIEEINSQSPTALIYNLIRGLDKGIGAEIDEILEKSDFNEAENIINNLLKEGEIFKTSPSRVKILE